MTEVRVRQHEWWMEAYRRWAEFEKLRAMQVPQYQLQELNAQLLYTLSRSPFYRERSALYPKRLADLAELANLPFTMKEDLRRGYPRELIAADESLIIRYGESTGTTGSPISSAITYRDWIRCNVAVQASVGHIFGVNDKVFVSIPYELAFASYDLDRALEAVGTTVVSTGALSSVCPIERVARMMVDVRPTGLICTPTRALRVFDTVKQAGHDPQGIGLRALLYVGETCSEAKLAKIRDLWGARLTTAYGATETNSLGLPCALGQLHLTEDRYIFEVIDVDSEQAVPDGAPGELVVTSIGVEALPLIRYRTGDEVIVSSIPCGCGSPRRTVRHYGRISERYSISGRHLNKLAVEQQILSTPGTGMYYAAGVEQNELVVRVQVEGGFPVEETLRNVEEGIAQTFSVPSQVGSASKELIMAAMDRMLKPGSLGLEHLKAMT